MKICRADGHVLYEDQSDNIKACLEAACKSRAYLAGANLAGANLARANLAGANLAGANLAGANLAGANLDARTTIDTGETWKVYLGEVVPALLAAGGKSVEEVVASGAWDCHSWTNCPMAVAFGVHDINDIPALFRHRANQFIKFFDANLIPCPGGAAATCKAGGAA